MKTYRLLNALGLVSAVGLSLWQVQFREGNPPFYALIFLGSAVGLFAFGVAHQVFKTRWGYVAWVGAAFLCLSLGAPTPLLLGTFAGLGSALLWKAYEAKTGGEAQRRGGQG